MGIRLVCAPHAGGDGWPYHRWARWLPQDVTVCPVHLPGRGTRIAEKPVRSVGAIVEGIVGALEPHVGRPYALFGHSFGGVVAFEVAREVRRRGWPAPVRLVVAATVPPDVHPDDLVSYSLSDDALVTEMRRIGGTPEAVLRDRQLVALLLPALRADLEAYARYAYVDEPPLAADLTVVGVGDPCVPTTVLDGWRRHTSGTFTSYLIAGGHFFPIADPEHFAGLLARELIGPVARAAP